MKKIHENRCGPPHKDIFRGKNNKNNLFFSVNQEACEVAGLKGGE
jgi:hypothetical protein